MFLQDRRISLVPFPHEINVLLCVAAHFLCDAVFPLFTGIRLWRKVWSRVCSNWWQTRGRDSPFSFWSSQRAKRAFSSPRVHIAARWEDDFWTYITISVITYYYYWNRSGRAKERKAIFYRRWTSRRSVIYQSEWETFFFSISFCLLFVTSIRILYSKIKWKLWTTSRRRKTTILPISLFE